LFKQCGIAVEVPRTAKVGRCGRTAGNLYVLAPTPPGEPIRHGTQMNRARHRIRFDEVSLARVRAGALEQVRRFQLTEREESGFALAVSELASNSVKHGGGAGTLTIWAIAANTSSPRSTTMTG
jgi:hypothetical protein